MMIEMLKCKLHRATVTDANLEYEGSITVDRDLMDAAGLFENEKVSIYNITNGARFDTYVIEGPRGQRDICLNGAAARLVHKGDMVIICSYCIVDQKEAADHHPTVILVDENNNVREGVHPR